MMNIYARAALLGALLFCSARGQDTKRSPQPNSSDGAIKILAGPCSAMPPELAADCFLRIAAKSSSGSVTQRIRLIEDALALAPRATDPTMVKAEVGSAADSLESVHGRATALKMTSAGLLARSLDALLSLDSQRALDLAAYVRTPELRVDADALEVPDVSDLFSAFGRIAAAMKPRDRLAFVDRQARSITSPVEVGPVAALIGNTNLDSSDLQYLANVSLPVGLQACERNARGFQYTQYDTRQTLISLLLKCRDVGVGTTGLVAAFDRYYRRQITAPGICSPASLASAKHDLNRLNDFVFPKGDVVQQEDLSCDATPPPQNEQGEKMFQCSSSRDLLLVEQRMHSVPKDSAEFAKRFDDLVRAINSWTSPTDSSRVFLHEKAGLYVGLIYMAPNATESVRVATLLLEFLDSNFLPDHPTEWFLHVKNALDAVEAARKQGVNVQAVLFHNPVIAYYWNLATG